MFDALKPTQKYVPPTVASNLLSLCEKAGGATPQEIGVEGLNYGLSWSIVMKEVHALETAGKLKKEGGNWYTTQKGKK